MSTPNETPVPSPAREPGRLELKIPPPVIAGAIAGCMWVMARIFPVLDVPAGIRVTVALLLAIAGVFLSGWGIATFRRVRTTTNPHKPHDATALVSAGPYRFTRNPMYSGMLLILAALTVFLASLPASVGPVAFILYIDRFQIEPEERALQCLFGSEYTAYLAKVRRWL